MSTPVIPSGGGELSDAQIADMLDSFGMKSTPEAVSAFKAGNQAGGTTARVNWSYPESTAPPGTVRRQGKGPRPSAKAPKTKTTTVVRTADAALAWLDTIQTQDPTQYATIRNKLIASGVIDSTATSIQVMSAWKDVVTNAARAYDVDNSTTVTPLSLLDQYAKTGMGTADTSKAKTTESIALSSPEDIQARYQSIGQQMIGQNPDVSEAPVGAVNAAEAANPQVSAVDSTGLQKVITKGLGQAAIDKILEDRAKQNPQYGAYQAATTYYNALLQTARPGRVHGEQRVTRLPIPGDGDHNLNLMQILQQAGFKGSGLATAYAVVMAESGSNALAHNDNRKTGDDSYGLFQINMIDTLGTARLKQFGLKSKEDLLDPVVNAKVAFAISKGGKDFGAWSTYNSGAYTKYLPDASVVAGTPKGGTVTTPRTQEPLPEVPRQATSAMEQVAAPTYDDQRRTPVHGHPGCRQDGGGHPRPCHHHWPALRSPRLPSRPRRQRCSDRPRRRPAGAT